jgi:hypothetical protein
MWCCTPLDGRSDFSLFPAAAGERFWRIDSGADLVAHRADGVQLCHRRGYLGSVMP